MKIVVDCSTTGPGVARIAHAELAKAGIVYMDAPVSGGMAGARDGTLAIMVSGQRAVYDRIEPAIKQFGKLFYCGEGAGLAQIMKLANNIIAAGVIVMSAEVIAMGTKAGLNPRQMCDIINVEQRPQQRDAGQVPALRAARHVRLRLRDGPLL